MLEILSWGGAYLTTPLDFTRALLLVALFLTFVKACVLRRWYVAACLLPPLLYWLDLTLLETVPWAQQLTWLRVAVNVGYAGMVARIYVDIRRGETFQSEMDEKDTEMDEKNNQLDRKDREMDEKNQETTRLRDSLNRRKRAGPGGADLPKTAYG
ncbi:MAG: hypothetical protein AVDCRST_MAG86-3279 [uncultured Truepera sp.]|uniref:Uncharacterized protein n=1 Tax=uncultured Truepera sp. TaxID=543023 RepID=A0A6J4VQ53_9DEIN|nr:MAG: hypothetical protein AVDCRST_MAG86-3279 [uncultured Truepera sp.]